MTPGAWIMLAFGCALLYGGLAFCLFIASSSKQFDSDETDEEMAGEDLMTSGGDG